MNMNKTAEALESVATLVAGIEMLGGSIVKLVAEPGNVNIRVGNGMTRSDIQAVLDGLGLEFEHGCTMYKNFGVALDEIIVRTGTYVETIIDVNLLAEDTENCAPHGVCTMAAIIARMTNAESVITGTMSEDSVHFDVDALMFAPEAQKLRSYCVTPTGEKNTQCLVRSGLRGFAKTVTVEFKPRRERLTPIGVECSTCRRTDAPLVWGPNPYAEEIHPGTPEAETPIWMCESCHQASCDDI